MKFELEHASNGIILTVDDGDDKEQYVYQRTDEGEIEAFAEFLWGILENYGPVTSRYSDKRIYIRVAPGDKNDAAECHCTCGDNCPWCI